MGAKVTIMFEEMAQANHHFFVYTEIDDLINHAASEVLGLDNAAVVVNGFQVLAFQVVIVGRAAGFFDAVARWIVVVRGAVDLFDPVVGVPGQRHRAVAADGGQAAVGVVPVAFKDRPGGAAPVRMLARRLPAL
jgi:hypothetical protein